MRILNLENLKNSGNIDILTMAISETWLSGNGYISKLFITDGLHNGGGGVCIYVRKDSIFEGSIFYFCTNLLPALDK